MPVRPVLQLGDPLLREKCLFVEDPTSDEIKDLVQDLQDTLAHWRSTTGYGRGIAAPQIGVLQRVIFLKLPGVEPWALVNPEIVESSEERMVVWDAARAFSPSSCRLNGDAGSRSGIRISRARPARSMLETIAICQNLCNTKSTIWTGSSPSTACLM